MPFQFGPTALRVSGGTCEKWLSYWAAQCWSHGMEMPNNNNNDRGKYVWDLRTAVKEMGTKPN